MSEVFLAVAYLCFGLSAALMIVILCASFGGLLSYGKIRLISDLSYEKARASHETVRTVATPALAALSTGLIVSLSASFLFEGFTDIDNQIYVPIGSALFLLAGVVFVVLIAPALRVVSLGYFTSTPEQILAVAKELSGREVDAEETLRTLRMQLREWENCCGARSMGWHSKRGSGALNSAMNGIPANSALRRRDAWKFMRKRAAFCSALRLSWWRLGWPLWILTALNVAGFLFWFTSGQAVFLAVVVAVFLVVLSVVVFVLYVLVELLQGARRLAQQKHCQNQCDAELGRADERIAENGIRRLEELMQECANQVSSADLRRLQLMAGANVILTAVGSLIALFVGSRRGRNTLER